MIDLKGMLAGFFLIFGTGVLFALFELSTWGVNTELSLTRDRLEDFLLSWAKVQTGQALGLPDDPALAGRCRVLMDEVLGSPVWKPMVTLKHLDPAAVATLARLWARAPGEGPGTAQAVEASAVSLFGKLKAFQVKQEEVDLVWDRLLLAAFLGLTVTFVAMLVLGSRKERMERQIRDLHQRSLVTLEEERKALSRDLHDTVAQDLAAVKMLFSSLAVDPSLKGPIGDSLDAALTHVRALATGLRPPSLDRIGFAESLRELCDSVSARSSLAVACDIPLGLVVPLGEAATVNLYRSAQEALTNAVRHSQGTRVVVALRSGEAGTTLEIGDNGRGFRPSGPGRLGLVGMKERARLIGAKMTVESSPQAGTRIRWEVPHEHPRR